MADDQGGLLNLVLCSFSKIVCIFYRAVEPIVNVSEKFNFPFGQVTSDGQDFPQEQSSRSEKSVQLFFNDNLISTTDKMPKRRVKTSATEKVRKSKFVNDNARRNRTKKIGKNKKVAVDSSINLSTVKDMSNDSHSVEEFQDHIKLSEVKTATSEVHVKLFKFKFDELVSVNGYVNVHSFCKKLEVNKFPVGSSEVDIENNHQNFSEGDSPQRSCSQDAGSVGCEDQLHDKSIKYSKDNSVSDEQSNHKRRSRFHQKSAKKSEKIINEQNCNDDATSEHPCTSCQMNSKQQVKCDFDSSFNKTKVSNDTVLLSSSETNEDVESHSMKTRNISRKSKTGVDVKFSPSAKEFSSSLNIGNNASNGADDASGSTVMFRGVRIRKCRISITEDERACVKDACSVSNTNAEDTPLLSKRVVKRLRRASQTNCDSRIELPPFESAKESHLNLPLKDASSACEICSDSTLVRSESILLDTECNNTNESSSFESSLNISGNGTTGADNASGSKVKFGSCKLRSRRVSIAKDETVHAKDACSVSIDDTEDTSLSSQNRVKRLRRASRTNRNSQTELPTVLYACEKSNINVKLPLKDAASVCEICSNNTQVSLESILSDTEYHSANKASSSLNIRESDLNDPDNASDSKVKFRGSRIGSHRISITNNDAVHLKGACLVSNNNTDSARLTSQRKAKRLRRASRTSDSQTESPTVKSVEESDANLNLPLKDASNGADDASGSTVMFRGVRIRKRRISITEDERACVKDACSVSNTNAEDTPLLSKRVVKRLRRASQTNCDSRIELPPFESAKESHLNLPLKDASSACEICSDSTLVRSESILLDTECNNTNESSSFESSLNISGNGTTGADNASDSKVKFCGSRIGSRRNSITKGETVYVKDTCLISNDNTENTPLSSQNIVTRLRSASRTTCDSRTESATLKSVGEESNLKLPVENVSSVREVGSDRGRVPSESILLGTEYHNSDESSPSFKSSSNGGSTGVDYTSDSKVKFGSGKKRSRRIGIAEGKSVHVKDSCSICAEGTRLSSQRNTQRRRRVSRTNCNSQSESPPIKSAFGDSAANLNLPLKDASSACEICSDSTLVPSESILFGTAHQSADMELTVHSNSNVKIQVADLENEISDGKLEVSNGGGVLPGNGQGNVERQSSSTMEANKNLVSIPASTANKTFTARVDGPKSSKVQRTRKPSEKGNRKLTDRRIENVERCIDSVVKSFSFDDSAEDNQSLCHQESTLLRKHKTRDESLFNNHVSRPYRKACEIKSEKPERQYCSICRDSVEKNKRTVRTKSRFASSKSLEAKETDKDDADRLVESVAPKETVPKNVDLTMEVENNRPKVQSTAGQNLFRPNYTNKRKSVNDSSTLTAKSVKAAKSLSEPINDGAEEESKDAIKIKRETTKNYKNTKEVPHELVSGDVDKSSFLQKPLIPSESETLDDNNNTNEDKNAKIDSTDVTVNDVSKSSTRSKTVKQGVLKDSPDVAVTNDVNSKLISIYETFSKYKSFFSEEDRDKLEMFTAQMPEIVSDAKCKNNRCEGGKRKRNKSCSSRQSQQGISLTEKHKRSDKVKHVETSQTRDKRVQNRRNTSNSTHSESDRSGGYKIKCSSSGQKDKFQKTSSGLTLSGNEKLSKSVKRQRHKSLDERKRNSLLKPIKMFHFDVECSTSFNVCDSTVRSPELLSEATQPSDDSLSKDEVFQSSESKSKKAKGVCATVNVAEKDVKCTDDSVRKSIIESALNQDCSISSTPNKGVTLKSWKIPKISQKKPNCEEVNTKAKVIDGQNISPMPVVRNLLCENVVDSTSNQSTCKAIYKKVKPKNRRKSKIRKKAEDVEDSFSAKKNSDDISSHPPGLLETDNCKNNLINDWLENFDVSKDTSDSGKLHVSALCSSSLLSKSVVQATDDDEINSAVKHIPHRSELDAEINDSNTTVASSHVKSTDISKAVENKREDSKAVNPVVESRELTESKCFILDDLQNEELDYELDDDDDQSFSVNSLHLENDYLDNVKENSEFDDGISEKGDSTECGMTTNVSNTERIDSNGINSNSSCENAPNIETLGAIEIHAENSFDADSADGYGFKTTNDVDCKRNDIDDKPTEYSPLADDVDDCVNQDNDLLDEVHSIVDNFDEDTQSAADGFASRERDAPFENVTDSVLSSACVSVRDGSAFSPSSDYMADDSICSYDSTAIERNSSEAGKTAIKAISDVENNCGSSREISVSSDDSGSNVDPEQEDEVELIKDDFKKEGLDIDAVLDDIPSEKLKEFYSLMCNCNDMKVYLVDIESEDKPNTYNRAIVLRDPIKGDEFIFYEFK